MLFCRDSKWPGNSTISNWQFGIDKVVEFSSQQFHSSHSWKLQFLPRSGWSTVFCLWDPMAHRNESANKLTLRLHLNRKQNTYFIWNSRYSPTKSPIWGGKGRNLAQTFPSETLEWWPCFSQYQPSFLLNINNTKLNWWPGLFFNYSYLCRDFFFVAVVNRPNGV